MSKFFVFVFFPLLVIFGCAFGNSASIIGIWQVTHLESTPATGDFYYEFRTDGSCSRDENLSELFTATADKTGTYSIDSYGVMKVSFFTNKYTVYMSGQIMYWYLSGVEKTRLLKQ
jgi:hypothetical protein